jgi:apolipoprotein N-acyltransferase
MSSLRAIERGHSPLRSDVDGLSGAFDYEGRELATQDTTTSPKNIMIVDLPVRGTATLYRRFRDLFAWQSIAITLALVGIGITLPVINKSQATLFSCT